MGKSLVQLDEEMGEELIITDIVEDPKDTDVAAVAKAQAVAKATAEADAIVTKQEIANAKSDAAAMENAVVSPVDPALAKK